MDDESATGLAPLTPRKDSHEPALNAERAATAASRPERSRPETWTNDAGQPLSPGACVYTGGALTGHASAPG